jgi:hypothetical protein
MASNRRPLGYDTYSMEDSSRQPEPLKITTVEGQTQPHGPSDIPELLPDVQAPAAPESQPEPDSAVQERFGSQRFVEEAPELDDQLADTSRQNTFRYARMPHRLDNFDPPEEAVIESVTEHDGLLALDRFLAEASQQHLEWDGEDLSGTAQAVRENLTFIGDKEYQQGAEGLSQLWRSYLDADPATQIYLLAGVSQNEDKRKSDQHLIEQVLGNFSDDELDRYAGRIVTSADALVVPPEQAKVLLVDDWTMSGSQLKAAVLAMSEDETLRPYLPSVEVNLIAASPQRIDQGLTALTRQGEVTIPVKAYYRTHEERSSSPYFLPGEMPVTGVHSSGDYGFEQVIDRIVAAQRANGQPAEMPPLTNVVREYRHAEPAIIKQPDGRLRHAPA